MKSLNKNIFKEFGLELFSNLMRDEELTINLRSEDSLFTRLTRARVRQITEVEQGYITLNLIKGNKSLTMNVLYSGEKERDLKICYEQIKIGRNLLSKMKEDPFLVRPVNYGESVIEIPSESYLGEELIDIILTEASEVDLAGLFTSGEIARGSMNSKGQFHWFKTQNFILDYSLYNSKQKAVKSVYSDLVFNKDDLRENLRSSKMKLQLMDREVKKIKRGEYKTFLAPSAVSELIGTLSWGGLSMSAHKRGQGSLKDLWKGEKNFSDKFTLLENFELGLCPRFNEVGELAPNTMAIIQNGKYRDFLTSTRTANEFKLDSNFASEWETMRSPEIKGGDLLEEEILKKLDTGLYISDLHYLNWSDRETARITGMTRYACFWVLDGELVSPIEDLRFDESYYHLFGSGLLDLTSKTQVIPHTGSYFERELGGTKVPGILVDNLKFTL